MQIDVTRKLMNMDGTPFNILSEECPACGRPRIDRVMLLRDAITNALTVDYADERGMNGQKKFERYQLALRVQNEDAPVLTVQELALAQELVAKRYAPLICGQVWAMLEGAKEGDED